jgi:FKBP-type peptidyl-prolyl cis-trans isomerase
MMKKKLRFSHFFFLVLFFGLSSLFISCENASKYPGYTEAEPGIYYKMHIPGENGKKAGPEDFYEVRMQNKFNGKVFYDSDLQTAKGTLLMQSSSSRYFSVLAEGDSATFLLPGSDLLMPGMPDSGMVEMNVKILHILKPDEVEKMEKSSDPDLDEQLFIHRYMAKNKLNMIPDSAGLYYQSLEEGTGNKPAAGLTIGVKYTGRLPNGTQVDGNNPASEPFRFTWGEEGQMIPGILRALSRMKQGGRAKIILPSPLAFGVNGSSNGIVPPHTPVIYELELVEVH